MMRKVVMLCVIVQSLQSWGAAGEKTYTFKLGRVEDVSAHSLVQVGYICKGQNIARASFLSAGTEEDCQEGPLPIGPDDEDSKLLISAALHRFQIFHEGTFSPDLIVRKFVKGTLTSFTDSKLKITGLPKKSSGVIALVLVLKVHHDDSKRQRAKFTCNPVSAPLGASISAPRSPVVVHAPPSPASSSSSTHLCSAFSSPEAYASFPPPPPVAAPLPPERGARVFPTAPLGGSHHHQ